MKWIARVFVFAAAFVFGIFATLLFSSPASRLSDSLLVASAPKTPASTVRTPLRAENLLGAWKGTWGHNSGDCTLQIDRVEGNAFYGTLRKEGAVVRFEGTIDPKTRTFRFNETKVVRLGADMTEWSLGKNSGTISEDGRILVGNGHDKWGQYAWAASNY